MCTLLGTVDSVHLSSNYQLRLKPSIEISYLAEPVPELEALTFANIFANVDDPIYNNAGLKLTSATIPTTGQLFAMAIKGHRA